MKDLEITAEDTAMVLAPKHDLSRSNTEISPMMSVFERAALDPSFNVDKLRELYAMKKEYEADEARKSYNKAFAAFKSESVQIIKNITVTDGPLKGKKYADLFAVVSATTAALSKYGLSSFWKLTKDDPEWMEVTCVLRHELGHSETVSMGGKPDVGGAKNAIQARASTKSYLERYTFLAITGQAACGEDNDGNGGSGSGGLTDQAFGEYMDTIQQAMDRDELTIKYTAAYKAATAANDKDAQKRFIEAKAIRFKEVK